MTKKCKWVMCFSIICFILVSSLVGTDMKVMAKSTWIDVGGGWEFRVDGPHVDGCTKYHVHARNKQEGKEGSECVDGTSSHGDHLNDVPKKVRNKIRDNNEYQKAKKKQKKLNDAKKEIKKKKLKIDWKHIADVVIAIGIVVVATGTFFFQGDDMAAWINFLRAIGC